MEWFWPTAIKIALEVALLYFEGLPKLMIDYHVYDLAYGSYSTLPLEKYQQQQHLGFCNWTNTFEVAFAMQCIAVQFFCGFVIHSGNTFCKQIGSKRPFQSSTVVRAIYRRLCGVATANTGRRGNPLTEFCPLLGFLMPFLREVVLPAREVRLVSFIWLFFIVCF